MFYGIEKSYADAMIRASRIAQQALFDTKVRDAVGLSHVRHKGDTLGLDQRPENALIAALQKFDPHGITITEERGAVNPFLIDGPSVLHGARTFFACDPFDRSIQALEFLSHHGQSDEQVVDVIRRLESGGLWETLYGKPLVITSSTSAISCVRRGLPIATVILNHFTGLSPIKYKAKPPALKRFIVSDLVVLRQFWAVARDSGHIPPMYNRYGAAEAGGGMMRTAFLRL